MGDISTNFSRHEFACKCGCGFDTVDVTLLELCEEVRQIEGHPLTPNCGCRCEKHNADAEVGGAPGSKHLLGQAADLPVRNPWKTYQALCLRYPRQYGFGVYDTFVHVDSRSTGPARWDKRTKR